MGCGISKTAYTPRDMRGKLVIITGGNAGLGICAAKDLLNLGANVVITSRNAARGQEAVEKLRKDVEGTATAGSVSMEVLDVAKLKSVEDFAARWAKRENTAIDVLINNAGIMMPPTRELTEDGFEAQWGTNHLGAFALTGRLMPFIKATSGSRVVNVSSIRADHAKQVEAFDFRQDGEYDAERIYDDSKLANLQFTLELSKRYPSVMAVTAHPGVSSTGLFSQNTYKNMTWMFQKPEIGAHPHVRAATDPEAQTNWYFGPTGMGGMRGEPEANIRKPKLANDEAYAAKLWAASVAATNVDF